MLWTNKIQLGTNKIQATHWDLGQLLGLLYILQVVVPAEKELCAGENIPRQVVGTQQRPALKGGCSLAGG